MHIIEAFNQTQENRDNIQRDINTLMMNLTSTSYQEYSSTIDSLKVIGDKVGASLKPLTENVAHIVTSFEATQDNISSVRLEINQVAMLLSHDYAKHKDTITTITEISEQIGLMVNPLTHGSEDE